MGVSWADVPIRVIPRSETMSNKEEGCGKDELVFFFRSAGVAFTSCTAVSGDFARFGRRSRGQVFFPAAQSEI